MTEYQEGVIHGLCIALIICGMLAVLTIGINKKNFKETAIKNECAYYHEKTGKFTWKVKNENYK